MVRLVIFVCVWLMVVTIVTSDDRISELEKMVEKLQTQLNMVTRQLMMTDFNAEENIRNDGNSGLKRIRIGQSGLRPHHSASYKDKNIASIHDHSNNIRTVGLGEMAVITNGVAFRTRHNDYKLVMKGNSKSSKPVDIPFPDVPQAVLQKTSVNEQVAEMTEWFRAWRDDDTSVRDFRPHFKPVLCYLEGSWTITDMDKLDEPFESDRHFIDAPSWYKLHEKVRFQAYAGKKDTNENIAHLPTRLMFNISGDLVQAQWTYQILCHPLRQYLSPKLLHPVVDLKTRVMAKYDLESYVKSRACLFRVVRDPNPVKARRAWASDIERLMTEIPGLDGYGAMIEDDALGTKTYSYLSSMSPMNVANYSSVYSFANKGAMGTKTQKRGFSDETLFVAQNTQPHVPAVSVTKYDKSSGQTMTWSQRWSYAIPLEIIYLTPLSKWNPHNIIYRGDANTREGKQIFSKGATASKNSEDKPFDGINSKVYYQTPEEFFASSIKGEAADMTKKKVHVLGADGLPHNMAASGIRIFLPKISDLDEMRQRYPVMPVYSEGSDVMKELSALQDIIQQPNAHNFIIDDDPAKPTVSPTFKFKTDMSSIEQGTHEHPFTIRADQLKKARADGYIEIVTDYEAGHSHTLRLKCGRPNEDRVVIIEDCDENGRICWDGHTQVIGPSCNDMYTAIRGGGRKRT